MDIRENDRGGKEDLVVQSHQELQDSLRLPIIIIILVGPLFIVGTQMSEYVAEAPQWILLRKRGIFVGKGR